jgi:hypothetical protein
MSRSTAGQVYAALVIEVFSRIPAGPAPEPPADLVLVCMGLDIAATRMTGR